MATNLMPPGPLTYQGQIVTPSITRNSSPTTANYEFPVPTIWINPLLMKAWILVAKPLNVADWQPIGGGSEEVESMTVDTFTGPGTNPVLPNGSNTIIVTGGQVPAGTTANVIQTDSLAANTYTIEIQRSQAVGSSTVGDNGVSHFNSADFSVDSNGFVSAVSAGYARTVGVDAHTAPGTSPVVPTAGGLITVTGGQVPSGTTTHVIRTDSLAANTYTVEVQRSTTAASATVGLNGVAHFNSGDFTVDSNGFVSLATRNSYAFLANVTTTLSNVTGDNTFYTIIFDTIEVDHTGGAYNTSTGLFTTAVAGFYSLSACTLSGGYTNAMTTGKLIFVINSANQIDSVRGNYYNMSDAGGNLGLSIQSNYYLNIGDTVQVNLQVAGGSKVVSIFGSTAESNDVTHFSCSLI